MISFKQYLNEVLVFDGGIKIKGKDSNALPNNGNPYKSDAEFNAELKLQYPSYKKICAFDNFEIYYILIKRNYGFYVYNKKQRRFTMYLTTHYVENKVIRINALGSTTFNQLKAHDFYHELIRRGYILHTDIQSEGAQLVWSKLSKFKDVNIHGWFNGKAINISFAKDSDEIYVDRDLGDIYSDGETVSEYGMGLVAHKK